MGADYQGKDSLVKEEGELKYKQEGQQPDETTLVVAPVFSSRVWDFDIAVLAIPGGDEVKLAKNPEPVKNLDEIKEE